MASLPTLRWGVIGAGQVSSWFVQDISSVRPDAKADHVIQAIGSSSTAKGNAFVEQYIPDYSPPPTIYNNYADVYADPQVDIVYIGIPHGFHKQACLDAIAAGKHVLCEKTFAITAREAEEVFAAAKAKGGIFVMEALRMRFFPLVQQLLKLVHEVKAIGNVHRVFCDLGLDMDVSSLGQESRLRNAALGAGTLLDICIYSLTWGILLLDPHRQRQLQVKAFQTLFEGIDTASSVIVFEPTTGAQGILTSTAMAKTPSTFCRIEGTEGYVTVEGESASIPTAFTVHRKPLEEEGQCPKPERVVLEPPGWGLYWEADAAAQDIAAGRTENDIMPWIETIHVLKMMDEVRRQGGARFPQDTQ